MPLRKRIAVAVLVMVAVGFIQQRGCSLSSWPSVISMPAATAAVYVYEKDDTAIPPAVLSAFDKLNRQGVSATTFDKDTKNGRGETPAQYRGALIAATNAGLPALVVTARGGDEVLRTVKAPTTEEQVLEAVR